MNDIASSTRRPIAVETEPRLARVLTADRRFFERHGGRRLRLRPAPAAEVADLDEACGPRVAPEGKRLFALVMVLDADPGERVRLFGYASPGTETDVSEDFLRVMLGLMEAHYGRLCPETRWGGFRFLEDHDA